MPAAVGVNVIECLQLFSQEVPGSLHGQTNQSLPLGDSLLLRKRSEVLLPAGTAVECALDAWASPRGG
jgi:hypothetical protein